MPKISDAQFKADLDSITYDDILKLREAKTNHALKLEDLELTLKQADGYIEVMREFLEELNYSSDRIDSFECRRRDGYFPHSYNKGGLEGICYLPQTFLPNGNTGFKNTDEVLERGYKYDLESFLEDRKLTELDYDNDSQLQDFDEYRQSSDDTIQFQARIMMTSETTANVDFYVSASDSPYHRSSDDKLEIEIEFKSPAGMKRKLAAILKRDFVKCLKNNVREGF